MRFLSVFVLVQILLSGVSASAAESRKELGLRLDAATQRIQVLEDRMLTGDPAAVRLQQRVDELERQLRGQVGENERLRFENARQRSDIDAIRKELDLLNTDVRQAREDAASARTALGGYITGGSEDGVTASDGFADGAASAGFADGAASAADARPASTDVPPTDIPDDAEARFADSRHILENGFFDQAYTSLQGFVQDFPKHKRSGEALYWLGEIQMVRGNASGAAEHYVASLKNFRKGERAPDAMVKLAAAFAAMGDKEEACRTLKLFPREYPKANAAVKTKADIERRRAGCAP
jgi:tol-pal system protein YbgF